MNTKLFIKSVLATALIAQSSQAFSAKYEVKEITPLDKYRQHFSTGLNDSGTVVGVTRDTFNFPFYLESYLDNYETSCNLSDSELASGNFDASSTTCLKSVLSSFSTNPLYQKVSESKSFINSGNETILAILTDVIDSDLGDYTNSNTEQLNAINSNEMAVGTATAPFIPVDFTVISDGVETEYKFWQRDYLTRAVVYINGDTEAIEIEPAFDDYGGVTSAVDISDENYVAGYSSIGFADGAQTSIETDCTEESSPLLVCVWVKQQSGNIYTTRPYIWKLDDFGEVESSQEFGLGITLDEDQSSTSYSAIITAVNDDGVGVGYGHVRKSDESIRIQPLLFGGGSNGTESLIDNDLYDAGYATDINNSNIVVGKVQTFDNNVFNDEFFIYDILNDKLETPTTFYRTAESSASAINDHGVIIGEAEYEITTESVRRKHGFIYYSGKDHEGERFFDINNLIGCNSEFEIVEMKDINNNNQIAATALKLVESRDAAGDVVSDSTGEAVMEQIAVSVLLSPISGEIEACSEDEADKYKRKGLSSTPMLLVFLSTLLYIRRRSL